MLFQGKSDDEMLRCHVGNEQAPDPRGIAKDREPLHCCWKTDGQDPDNRHRDWKLNARRFESRARGTSPWPALPPAFGSSIKLDR